MFTRLKTGLGFGKTTAPRQSGLAVLGETFTALALAITALTIATGLQTRLPGPDWITWPTAIGAAVAIDAVWLAGLGMLGAALKVRGSMLAMAGAMAGAGVVGSVTAILTFGHTLLFAAPTLVGMLLLTADRTRAHITPDADTVRDIDKQRRDELNATVLTKAAKRINKTAESRKADERAIAAAKATAAAVDLMRYQVVQRTAELEAKAVLYAELQAAVDAHQEAADKLDDLLDGAPARAALEATDGRVSAGGERGAISADTGAHATVSGTAFESVMDDGELTAVGFEVWHAMTRPRSKKAFRQAFRDAGFSGSDKRLNALYDRFAAEAVADATDVVSADTDTDE